MNSSKIETSECPKDSFKHFIEDYLKNFLNIFGIITNGLCIIIFIKILKRTQINQGNMFKYLLMKSVMDFLNFVSNSFEYFYQCSNNCRTSSTFIIQIWYVWFYAYFEYIFETVSAIFEIAATFDCYININTKLKCLQTNVFFYIFSFSIIIINCIYYLIFPLGFVIKTRLEVDLNDNETFSYNYHEYNDFGDSPIYFDLYFVDSLIRDGIFFIILFILNVMILMLLKRATERKRMLVHNNTNSNILLSSQNAQRKKMIMIISTGLNYMIGHFSYFVLTVLYTFYKDFKFFCFYQYVYFVYFLSYADGIFFYFFFNNIFKRFLIGLIPFLNKK
jgi:hypothetical protein